MGVQGVSGQELRALDAASQVRTPAPTDPARPAVFAREDAPRQAAEREPRPERPEPPPPPTSSGVRFSYDDATGRVVAQILDKDNQVIKQVPPEELLDTIAKLRETFAQVFDVYV